MQMARPEMEKLREWFNNEVAVRHPPAVYSIHLV